MPITSEAAADVAIIGAGPAGLTAAYMLTKAGYSVIVIEKDPSYVGGISRTVEHQGFRFDIGGHRFFSKSREVVDLWNEILPNDFIQRPRMSRIFYDGKYYSYPLRGFEALAQPRAVALGDVHGLLRQDPAVPAQERDFVPGLDHQPVRRAALQYLLQDLHREGVGHAVRRDFGRLGGAANQGA